MQKENRREFIKKIGLATISVAGANSIANAFGLEKTEDFFKISLAEWSLNQSLFSGRLNNLEFPAKAKNDFGIDIVEYVSVFFNKKETDKSYLKELLQRSQDLGVDNHLIMVDGEGDLGDTNSVARQTAVENHYKWIEAAKYLGCRTIRVNASGKGTEKEVSSAAVDGLAKLTAFGKEHKINVIVENHGGYSSDGAWLAHVIKQVDSPFCGTLPDFGNFKISPTQEYDKYLGVKQMMPFAKGVSAKTYDFDSNGNEKNIDYKKMFDIIKASGWQGIVGIEYEGSTLPASEGIKATKNLLEKIRKSY